MLFLQYQHGYENLADASTVLLWSSLGRRCLKKTGATRSKRRQDFRIHAGIGETVYPTCLSQLRSPHSNTAIMLISVPCGIGTRNREITAHTTAFPGQHPSVLTRALLCHGLWDGQGRNLYQSASQVVGSWRLCETSWIKPIILHNT